MSDTTGPASPSPSYGNESWHRVKVGEPVHRKLSAYGKYLRTLLRREHQFDRTCELIYESPKLREFTLALGALHGFGLSAKKLNVAKSVVDSYVARIGKRRAMPQFALNDVDWSVERRAKDCRKWLIGKMTESQFDRLSRRALKDSAITRVGLTLITDGDDDIVAERLLSSELLIDPRETMYGDPRQMLRVRRVARDRLLELYPDDTCQLAIKTASQAEVQPWDVDSSTGRKLDLSGYVDVWHGWALPSGRADDDAPIGGRYAMCVDTGTLVSEEWTSPRFPIAVCRYDDAQHGWHGVGLLEAIADIQHNINNLVRDIQQNVEVAGKLIMAVNEAFDLPVETMTGAKPFKLKYKGTSEPKIFVPNAINGAHVEWLKFWIGQAYDLPGVSQAMATSRSSLGLNASGIALDTQADLDSERFSSQEMNYSNYRLDASQLYLDGAVAIQKRREGRKGKKRPFVSMYTTGGRREELDFASVALEEGKYELQLEPVNFIPDTRAGKLSTVQELAKAGVIPQWMVGALFDEPDIARGNAIAFADYHNLQRIMEDLESVTIDLGELMPESYHNLTLSLVVGRAYYNRLQTKKKVPEEVFERYRKWITAVIDLQDELKQKQAEALAAMPPPGASGPMPPAGGPPGAGGPGLPPGMGPPNGVPVPGVIAPPMAA